MSCAVQNPLRAPAPKPGGGIKKQRQLKQHHSSEQSLQVITVWLQCTEMQGTKSDCAPPGQHGDSPECSEEGKPCL